MPRGTAQRTQRKLLEAFDRSEKKSVTDVCKIAGVIRATFYFHFYNHSVFRQAWLQKQRENLANKIQTMGA